MLQFYYQPDRQQAVNGLTDQLSRQLSAGRRVLWFVSGGSNAALSVEVARRLHSGGTAGQLRGLTIMLCDERYGVVGHRDSNWRTLHDAGFDAGSATVIETLQPDLTLEDTRDRFERDVLQALENSDTVIAQLGMGGDGHVAGILPQSPAAEADRLVASYDGGQYTRITITPAVFGHIDAAYTFVYGADKLDALRRLQSEDLPVADQPAQLLKTIPESYVYTDLNLNGDQS